MKNAFKGPLENGLIHDGWDYSMPVEYSMSYFLAILFSPPVSQIHSWQDEAICGTINGHGDKGARFIRHLPHSLIPIGGRYEKAENGHGRSGTHRLAVSHARFEQAWRIRPGSRRRPPSGQKGGNGKGVPHPHL
jgi:hypothetical protein